MEGGERREQGWEERREKVGKGRRKGRESRGGRREGQREGWKERQKGRDRGREDREEKSEYNFKERKGGSVCRGVHVDEYHVLYTVPTSAIQDREQNMFCKSQHSIFLNVTRLTECLQKQRQRLSRPLSVVYTTKPS